MTNTVANVSSTDSVRAVCAQHRRLLKRLESVAHYLGGVVAGMWLPGMDSTFDSPVRKVGGKRPVFLTLEVSDNGTLNFTGAISRLKNDQFVFGPIFAYDVSIPFTHRGGGRVLPANNIVIARRANELLGALIAYARDVSFGVQPELSPAVFPDVVCDANGTIFEDYTPVLGFALPNPAKDIQTVKIRSQNPAAKILARHGFNSFMDVVDHGQRYQIVSEFKAEFPDFNIDTDAVVFALLESRSEFFTFSLPIEEALAAAPQSVADTLRSQVAHKYQFDVSYNDLLRAAKNPEEKLKISRFSAIQIFPVETVQDLPESYAGTVLAPLDWAPVKPCITPDAGSTT
jgi:hypothetical protein